MNNRILITIKKELRGIIRDKKSLMMMLVTPILIPIFILLCMRQCWIKMNLPIHII